MKDTTRAILQHTNPPTLFVLIADQTPSNTQTAIWIPFLNQDTPCHCGPDKIARRTNFPVIYYDVQRVRRGYYEIHASLLATKPKELIHGDLTVRYFNKLEEIINKEPGNWLWSHKRWKHKRMGNEE